MLYVLGVEEDEKNHRKHCRSRQLLHIDSLSIQTLRHEWEPRGSGGSSSSSRGAEEPCNRSAGKNNQHIEVVWENIEKHVSIIKVNNLSFISSTCTLFYCFFYQESSCVASSSSFCADQYGF